MGTPSFSLWDRTVDPDSAEKVWRQSRVTWETEKKGRQDMEQSSPSRCPSFHRLSSFLYLERMWPELRGGENQVRHRHSVQSHLEVKPLPFRSPLQNSPWYGQSRGQEAASSGPVSMALPKEKLGTIAVTHSRKKML